MYNWNLGTLNSLKLSLNHYFFSFLKIKFVTLGKVVIIHKTIKWNFGVHIFVFLSSLDVISCYLLKLYQEIPALLICSLGTILVMNWGLNWTPTNIYYTYVRVKQCFLFDKICHFCDQNIWKMFYCKFDWIFLFFQKILSNFRSHKIEKNNLGVVESLWMILFTYPAATRWWGQVELLN